MCFYESSTCKTLSLALTNIKFSWYLKRIRTQPFPITVFILNSSIPSPSYPRSGAKLRESWATSSALFIYLFFFCDRVLLSCPSWPQTHDPSTSACRLQPCATTHSWVLTKNWVRKRTLPNDEPHYSQLVAGVRWLVPIISDSSLKIFLLCYFRSLTFYFS